MKAGTSLRALLVGWLVLGTLGGEEAGDAAKPPATGADVPAVANGGRLPPKFKGIKQKPVNFREPQREYVAVIANGWTIEVEKQLQEEDPELARKAVQRFSRKLEESLALFPSSSRSYLRKVRMFMMYGPKAKGDGRDNGTEYFQPSAPDCYDTLDPRWRHAIVMYSAENYVAQSRVWALKLPLHELAHAWHLGQWAEDRAEICRAYDNAMSRKLYRNVHGEDGREIEKAYAMENPMEYFAELSCIYFAQCDYAPHNRKELEAYDPEGYAMVRLIWDIKD